MITGLGNFEMSAAKSQAGGGGGGGGGQPTKANYTLYGDSEELNRQAATMNGLVSFYICRNWRITEKFLR